jgi:hypothetical protein
MKISRSLVYALLTAILAGILTLVTWQINGFIITGAKTPFTYISFCAWATYFFVGANPKAAFKAFYSIAAGAIAAILMFVLSVAFGFAPWWAVPLAVVILVIPMMLTDKWHLNQAAVFIGTGLYFSISAAGGVASFDAKGYALAGLGELFYVLVGFIAGWFTIQFYVLCSKAGSKKAEPEAAVEREKVLK